MEEYFNEATEKMALALEKMEERFRNIRAGRANAAILDGVLVNYYGMATPINQMATITIPEARQIAIKPFDKNSLGEIEKAISEANLGLVPNNNGDFVIINIPVLTEETRKDYVKQIKLIAEETRIILRNIRQETIHKIKQANESKDEEKTAIDEMQTIINKYNKAVEEKTSQKETDLLKV